MARELEVGYVRILPDGSKFNAAFDKIIKSAGAEAAGQLIGSDLMEGIADGLDKRLPDPLENVPAEPEKKGKSIGKRFSGALGKALKTGALAAGATAIAVAGTAMVKGFGRLKAIDSAEAKLRGLGYTATDISGIMTDVTDAVTGTAFGLDEAATASASALASGVKPGKELTEYLQLIGDAATQGGASFGEMASIINKTTATGKVGMENINQLSERGIGIMAWLAEEYGVTGAELSKMVSAGEVDVKTFHRVLNENIGGAALESGNTFSGALANMQSALGRAGAKVLQGAFKQMPALFSNIGTQIDKVGPIAEKAGEALGGSFASGVNWIKDAVKAIDWAPIRDGAGQFLEIAKTLGTQFKEDLLPALIDFGKMAASALVPVIKAVAPAVVDLAKSIASRVIPAVSKLMNFMSKYQNVIIPIAAGIVTIVAAMKTWAAIIKTVAAVKKAWIAVQAALNVVMSANPIGLIVLAIAGLAVGLVVAYKRSETFRKIVNAAWEGIKNGFTAAWNWIKKQFEAFKVGLKTLWERALVAKDWIVGAWDSIKKGFQVAWNVVKKLFNLWLAQYKFLWKGAMAAKDKIVGAWDSVKKGTRAAFDWVKDKVSDLVEAFKSIPAKLGEIGGDLLEAGKGAGKAIIDGIGKGLSKTKDFVVDMADSIWQAIKKLINKGIDGINDALTFEIQMPKVLGGKSIPVSAPDIPKLATGGRVNYPGASRRHDADDVPAMLTAGEHITRKKSTVSMDKLFPGWLDHINRYGRPPGYADGGRITATNVNVPGVKVAVQDPRNRSTSDRPLIGQAVFQGADAAEIMDEFSWRVRTASNSGVYGLA